MFNVSASLPLGNGEAVDVAGIVVLSDGRFGLWIKAPRAGVYRVSHTDFRGLIVVETSGSGWEHHCGMICEGQG